jgi:hypothetical protein
MTAAAAAAAAMADRRPRRRRHNATNSLQRPLTTLTTLALLVLLCVGVVQVLRGEKALEGVPSTGTIGRRRQLRRGLGGSGRVQQACQGRGRVAGQGLP